MNKIGKIVIKAVPNPVKQMSTIFYVTHDDFKPVCSVGISYFLIMTRTVLNLMKYCDYSLKYFIITAIHALGVTCDSSKVGNSSI